MRARTALRLFAWLSIAFATAFAAGNENTVVQWTRDHALRLKTVEAGNGFDDMEPLQKVVGDARIVELGEATHGSREFFQLKHRMLEFLATKMGFSVFAIESNMPEAYKLNDYVLNGNGDPAKLLKGMYFWTWDTQEVLDMVRWMREFNRSGKGRLQFTGFDMQTPHVAIDIVRDFVSSNEPSYSKTLQNAADLAKAATPSGNASFGVARGTFPVQQAASKKVRFSGYIKTEGVNHGWAGLWWRVDGASGVLAFDNMQDRGVTGTTDWKEYRIELPVAADAKNINFGAILSGDGVAWFDDWKIELDGVPYLDTSGFDLSFESPTPRGFYTGGNGYQVQIDQNLAHGGKQSLQMKFLPQTAMSAVDGGTAAAAWKDVLRHLEGSRASYRNSGPSASDIEWAIQNARVVLQSLQMKTGEVSRDQSMAANIKWIADQNPNAKIVVWAHNGHVAYGGFPGYEPMGAALRKEFGERIVSFGFAFNEGSFQSVQMGKGLRTFTVGPAPDGSLDATLAATGIPLFALDLRTVPKTGPVSDWLRRSHQTRSIGAIYSEDSAQQYWANENITASYDALLFVEKTSAARKNP